MDEELKGGLFTLKEDVGRLEQACLEGNEDQAYKLIDVLICDFFVLRQFVRRMNNRKKEWK